MVVLANILKRKSVNKEILLKENNLKNNKLPIWFINIDSELVDNTLIDALKILPANFIIYSKKETFSNLDNICFVKELKDEIETGFDFIVCIEDIKLLGHIKLWIVPIVSKSNNLWSLLTEFNAASVEWNSFIFENDSLCDIYYAIIRYVENFKFSYDNRALVKNVLNV
jgi:hypothetical protein